MAKFKVGDKVWVPAKQKRGVIRGVSATGNQYDVEFMGGGGAYVNEEGLELLQALGNSCAATNAKFKVGDRVKYKGYHPKIRGKSGTVSFVGIPGDDPTYLTVDMDNGEEWGAPEKDWVLSNARACNAIKVGDKVRIKGWQGIWEVTKTPPGMLEVKSDDGFVGTTQVEKATPVKGANACNSRNAVVAKALNACARNGGIDDFNVGDRVMVRSIVGFTPTAPKPGTITAIFKSDNRIAVKKDDGGRGLFDASLVTKNACGTARNGSLGEDAALGISYAREAVAKLNSAVPLIEKWIASGKGHPNAVADGKRLVAGIKKAVAILNPVV